jgi:protein O-mannosyl-transferase
MPRRKEKLLLICITAALIISVMLVFWQVHNFAFVNYDDGVYVAENPNIQAGINSQSVRWAFTTGYFGNWNPLTWLSYMVDWHLSALDAKGYHITNMILHLANTLLLFFVLRQMTGAMWRSAFVAALFALHPLHVEPVAWVSGRKDLLSTLFWLLTMIAYVWYTRGPSLRRYMVVLLMFLLGIMAKPMVVTLPLVLLLLDYWPLGRMTSPDLRTIRRLAVEKTPLFALAIIFSVIAFLTQRDIGAVSQFTKVSTQLSICNALTSYFRYVEKVFWPGGLAAFYPYPVDGVSLACAAVSAMTLLAVTVLVIRLAGKHRYLLTGWFWYLGTLIPVIGIIQVGSHAMADRYTYITLTGVFVMISWGISDLTTRWPWRAAILALAAAAVLIVIGICAYVQTGYWADSLTLFSHAVKATQANYLAYNNLGLAYDELGRTNEAVGCFGQALAIYPDLAEAQNNMGNIYSRSGRSQDATDAYRRAVASRPDYAEAHFNLANELRSQGRVDEACDEYRHALRIRKDWPACMSNLALLIAVYPDLKGRNPDEAVYLAQRACELTYHMEPVLVTTLAAAYASAGRFGEAVEAAQRAAAMADAGGQPQLANVIRQQLSLYRQGKAYTESARRPAAP